MRVLNLHVTSTIRIKQPWISLKPQLDLNCNDVF